MKDQVPAPIGMAAVSLCLFLMIGAILVLVAVDMPILGRIGAGLAIILFAQGMANAQASVREAFVRLQCNADAREWERLRADIKPLPYEDDIES